MKIFEIKKQVGWSRIGKITWNNHSYSTPQLLWPIHPIFNSTMTQAFTLPILKKGTLLGYEIQDTLKIGNTFGETQENKIDNVPYATPFLLESLDLTGIPKPQSTISTDSSTNLIQNQVMLLAETFPNQSTYRYKDYEKEIFNLRMELYENIVFTHFPNQDFILELRICEWEEKIQLFIEFIQKHIKRIVGIKLSGFFENLGEFQKIIDWIGKLKTELPSDLIWIAGGQIFPTQYVLVTYLGFDLIDTRTLFIRGSEGLYLGNDNRTWVRDLRLPACGCPACEELNLLLPTKLTLESQKFISRHNVWFGWTEFKRIYATLDLYTIRTLLEEKIHSETYMASFLRILDKKYHSSINSRFPILCDHPVKCIGPESYFRPEVANFISRIQKNNTPGRNYKIIVLLPCASKKPYSKSQSHQRFMKAIRKAAGKQNQFVHQLIVTSPMGIIPRELESVFPIQHYDIPVTGDWDQTEIEQCCDAVVDWILKYDSKIKIIAHVNGGYKKAIEAAEMKIREKYSSSQCYEFHYSVSNPTISVQSDEALQSLEDLIHNNLEQQINNGNPAHNSRTISDAEILIRATADYQFGKGAGDLFLEHGAFINQGKNPNLDTIFMNDGAGKRQIGNLFHSNGLIKLSLPGGELLTELNGNDIMIEGNELNGTTIFRPILNQINMNLHPGNEIIIKNKDGEFIGIGDLILHPEDAISASSGAVARLRKKVIKESTFESNFENIAGDD